MKLSLNLLNMNHIINREHNFFEVKDGLPDYNKKDGWKIVFSDFVEWLKLNEKI